MCSAIAILYGNVTEGERKGGSKVQLGKQTCPLRPFYAAHSDTYVDDTLHITCDILLCFLHILDVKRSY